MIKVDDEHYMCFLYYVEEHDDLNRETTLKRIDDDYVDEYKSSVTLSFGQFADYLKANDYKMTKLYFNDPTFLEYFNKREQAVVDNDDFTITTRLYDSYVYNTIITANTLDRKSLSKIKLKHGETYRDDLYDEDFEVIIAFVHHECIGKRMHYLEYKNWILKMSN